MSRNIWIECKSYLIIDVGVFRIILQVFMKRFLMNQGKRRIVCVTILNS